MKGFYVVLSVALDNKFRSLFKKPITLLTLATSLLRLSSSVNLKSKMTPKRF